MLLTTVLIADFEKALSLDPDNLWGYRFIIEIKRCGDGIATVRPPADRRLGVGRKVYRAG